MKTMKRKGAWVTVVSLMLALVVILLILMVMNNLVRRGLA